MLTPIELQNTVLKSGMGYNKKEADAFLNMIIKDYEQLYKENMEFKDKLSVLSEGIQYYKNMETTLQKALVLAEKTSEETKALATKKASVIEKEANANAKSILADAKNELGRIQSQTATLIQEYEKYKVLYKRLALSQLDLLETEGFQLKTPTYCESPVEIAVAVDQSTENLQKTTNIRELEIDSSNKTDDFEFLDNQD